MAQIAPLPAAALIQVAPATTTTAAVETEAGEHPGTNNHGGDSSSIPPTHQAVTVPPTITTLDDGSDASNIAVDASLATPMGMHTNNLSSPTSVPPLSSPQSVLVQLISPTHGKSTSSENLASPASALGGKQTAWLPLETTATTSPLSPLSSSNNVTMSTSPSMMDKSLLAASTIVATNVITEHVSAFTLPSHWQFSSTGLFTWLGRCTMPPMALVLLIFLLPMKSVPNAALGETYTPSEHWLYHYIGMPLVGTVAGLCMCYRSCTLAGVTLRPITVLGCFLLLYSTTCIFAWASSSAGLIWWRVFGAECISMIWSVAAPRLLVRSQFHAAAVNTPHLVKSSGQVALTLVGLMIVAVGFLLLFIRLHGAAQDALIISLNGFAFLFRLALTIASRRQPMAYRVLLSSFYSIYLFDVFVAASLPSADEVTTLVLTAVIQLAVHVVTPLQLTRRYHRWKVSVERRLGFMQNEDWDSHLERHCAVYFFMLFAHWCVPFLFFWTTLVFAYGPLRESLPFYGQASDSIEQMLWFHGIQTISVTFQIIIFTWMVHHHHGVHMFELAYYVVRSSTWLLASFTLIAPMFGFALVLKQCGLQPDDDT